MSRFRRLAVVAMLSVSTVMGCSRAPEGRTRKTLQVAGVVVEQLNAPPYTYLRLKTDAGDVWAMVPSANVAKDERVTVVDGVLLKDFDTGLPGLRFDVVMGALERR